MPQMHVLLWCKMT